MDDRGAARWIASIFGRACKEPSDDPGLDPALDSATEIIARIHAEARAEAIEDAIAKSKAEWFRDTSTISWARVERAIIADEPKERDVEEYDLATADFEEYTITLQIPENIFKNLGFAPCKIKADLSPLSLLGANLRAQVERKLNEAER